MLLGEILMLLRRCLKRIRVILKVCRVSMIGVKRYVLALTHQSPSTQACIGVHLVHGLNGCLLIDILALHVSRRWCKVKVFDRRWLVIFSDRRG
jgi:hypothetical protein